MNYSSANSHKRATSQGHSTKHRRQQSKTPNGASSLSFDLTNSKLNNDKLNLSNVVHGRDPSYAGLESNLTSTLLQATLSSAAKAKFQYYSETARQDSLFLQSAPAQASGRFDFQKCLFPVKEGQKNMELGQTKEVESSLWDSPHSYVENNEEGSVPNNNNIEQANQESDSNIRKSDYASKRKEIEDIEKLGLNNFGTIKRLKEMIHKLQLKDAIQRQEIEKLKRINQRIKKDSKVFEERANSLERIRIQEFQTMRSPGHAENKAYNMPRKSRPDINTSFHDGPSGQDNNSSVKSVTLTQQIEQIALEKARLEETLKNLLLEREMSKPNINNIKGNNADLDTIPVKETPRRGLNINSLMPTPNAAVNADNLQPFPVVRTPQRDASVRSNSVGRSSARLHEESISTPKRQTQQKSNEIPTEKKHQSKKVSELSSREGSPVVKIGPQTSCAANSYRSGRMSPIDLIFGVPSVSKKEQTPKLSSTRNSPSRERLSAKKEKESIISPAQQDKKYRKDNQVVNKNVLSIDCNPRRVSGVEMKNTSNNVLNDSSITPVKALPLFNERSFLDESKSSDSHANSSYLNNVSPAVLEIILQHQKNPHVKANTRKNSASNYSSVESGVPVNLNETYSTKLNLEHLFASHGREKENKKISLEKKNDDGSVTSINIVNALCQGLTHVKIDPQTIPKQIKENKKDETIDYASEDKTHRKIPLDEINIVQKLTNYVKSETSTQVPSQNNVSISYQESMNKSDISLNTSACPVILSAQPQGKTISSKRAQLALETLRAKMQKRET